jgi:UDP-glucose 4-epimerase
VLITGGAGFIGSHVAREVIALGMTPVVFDDLSGGFKENIPTGVEFIEGSIVDSNLVNAIFQKHQFRFVYHLAAYAAEGLSHFIKKFNYENNLVGSVNLINASVNTGVECFVFTSSIAVYGKNQLPMTEQMVPQPEDSYGIAKYAVELELKASHDMFGLNYVIFRPHNVYGENQNIGDKYRNVLGIFMNQIMQGKPLSIFGDGSQTRAFSYIDDVAPIIARAPQVPAALGQVFNVGADQAYTVKQLAHEVCKAFNVEPQIKYYPGRNEVMHAYSDHAKVRGVFDPPSNVSLEIGIQKMAAWAHAAGARQGQKFSSIEISKNLPSAWVDIEQEKKV